MNSFKQIKWRQYIYSSIDKLEDKLLSITWELQDILQLMSYTFLKTCLKIKVDEKESKKYMSCKRIKEFYEHILAYL